MIVLNKQQNNLMKTKKIAKTILGEDIQKSNYEQSVSTNILKSEQPSFILFVVFTFCNKIFSLVRKISRFLISFSGKCVFLLLK